MPELLTLELTCFGTPAARLGNEAPPPDVVWRKNLALLIYLALSPGGSRPRSHVLGLLWPEKDEAHARHSLNEALRRLRASLGPARLLVDGGAITLNPEGLVVDALRFETVAQANPSEAIALFRGDFLEGFAVEDAPEFEDWAAGQRARLRAAGALALVVHGEARLGAGRLADAEAAALRASELEPYSEPACQLQMRAAALAGDPARALKACHAFTERLRQIGEEPSRALTGLAARIRSGRWQERDGSRSRDESLLAGRAEALGKIEETIAQGLAHGPRTLLITGAFGMGKTRLLQHCLERLALEGAVTARVRPIESDRDTPWSTLRALLRAGLLDAPGLPGADSHALGVLAGLVPELAARFQAAQPRDHADVAAALASLLRALAEEAPVALAIDDAQLCDGATLAILRAALEQLQALPVVVIAASSPREPGAPRELLQLHQDIERGIAGAAIHLKPLALDDLRALIVALAPWCSDDADRDRLARRVAFETGGSPFLAVTLLRALTDVVPLREDALSWPPPGATLDSPLPVTAPDLVRRVILARLVQLDEAAKSVITAASIGSTTLDLDLISELTGTNGACLDAQLAVLERQQFLIFDGVRYVFAAPLVQHVVRSEGLTRGQAQQLRLQAITLLGDRQDLESRVLQAELWARAKPGQEAFAEATAAARMAIQAQSARLARRALDAAERAAAAEPALDRGVLDELRAMCAR